MQAYQNVLEVDTKAEQPKEWSDAQASLGWVVRVEGEHSSGDKARALFNQAIAAYQNALEVRTRADLPQLWAFTQLSVGDVLQDEAGRSSGAEADALFSQATQTYQSVLEVYTKNNFSQYWAGGELALASISLDTSHFDTCLQQFGQISHGLMDPRQELREDALRFLCEWGAGNKNAARETEKTLLAGATDLTPYYWDATATVSLLSKSPAFATDRASWIAFFNSFHSGDSAGTTKALRQLEPILQQ